MLGNRRSDVIKTLPCFSSILINIKTSSSLSPALVNDNQSIPTSHVYNNVSMSQTQVSDLNSNTEKGLLSNHTPQLGENNSRA